VPPRCHLFLVKTRSPMAIEWARDSPSSLLLPFRALNLMGGLATPGRRVAAPPRRSALGFFFLAPLRCECGRITSAGTRRTTNPAETGHASRNRPAPKGQNRLAQGRARRRSRRAPPWVNGQPRTSVALKGRYKCATNEPQMRHKREKPSVEMIRMPTSRATWPIGFAHPSVQNYAIHLHPVRNCS
jgi:hypothetical protein